MLIDTHCHIHFQAYKQDMDEVIRRTLASGVHMITVGTQKHTSRIGLEVAEKYKGVWAAVGLHPNHLVEQEFWDDDELPPADQTTPKIHTRSEIFDYEYYKQLASHPKCVAIGETGLDFYRIPETVDHTEAKLQQRETFIQHVNLATEMEMPLVIHCRDAYDEQADLVQELIEQGKLSKRGVVHCFSGTFKQAKRFVDLGFYIAFGGVITFPPRKKDELIDGLTSLQYTVRELSIDKILIETDAPYLTPVPFRGKRNEPGFVRHVAEKIAELRSLSFEDIERATTKNAITLFSLK